MLRAISEIAVAMRVRSLPEKPMCWASSRPFCRASTMSLSRAMTTFAISAVTGRLVVRAQAQAGAAFIEVERRGNAVKREAELDHGEGDVGLDADDYGVGTAQPSGLRDAAKRARRKGVHDVERADIDHNAPRSETADPLGQFVPELDQVLVGRS